jgi:hypothetical protein
MLSGRLQDDQLRLPGVGRSCRADQMAALTQGQTASQQVITSFTRART